VTDDVLLPSAETECIPLHSCSALLNLMCRCVHIRCVRLHSCCFFYSGHKCTCVHCAQELAAAAGVSDRLTYITADVLHLHSDPAAQALWGTQDWVVSENGVLHFFLDLQVSRRAGMGRPSCMMSPQYASSSSLPAASQTTKQWCCL
jgi:hypothetical protein